MISKVVLLVRDRGCPDNLENSRTNNHEKKETQDPRTHGILLMLFLNNVATLGNVLVKCSRSDSGICARHVGKNQRLALCMDPWALTDAERTSREYIDKSSKKSKSGNIASCPPLPHNPTRVEKLVSKNDLSGSISGSVLCTRVPLQDARAAALLRCFHS